MAEPRHPSLEECEAAGKGPSNWPGKPYEVGGLPDTPEERARFEAYMRGHCWAIGNYDEAQRSYDTTFVRCCYGVWRDRGALPTIYADGVALPIPTFEQVMEIAGKHDTEKNAGLMAFARELLSTYGVKEVPRG